MKQEHEYTTRIVWIGDLGQGTANYRAYDRTWNIETPDKPIIQCSNDPLLGGDPHKPNPEDLLLSALSACHMLWYLHLASDAGIVVRAYTDNPIAVGITETNGAGRFLRATLLPQITVVSNTDLEQAEQIHSQIHQYCFIARSVNFPVDCQASYVEQG